ncbi:MAG: hypothetical protein A2131_01390 [Candidatus Sungbacteria bacterium GWC2_49_10]|uniref:50S ribosomal protein L35 n=1 Tax=Candidatus Sungbacteria bacterium GWC2_49_10 TaxID=1802263 RepID=A0A1G2K0R1_9BACT|nr:MAG: hypothetical protein A2131_01390 [Candidatus Sungbacteria bacterium GWC2_49_10]
MRKAFTKRIKITKTGKLLYRQAGQNHFNAKESKKAQKRKKAFSSFSPGVERKMRVYQNS